MHVINLLDRINKKNGTRDYNHAYPNNTQQYWRQTNSWRPILYLYYTGFKRALNVQEV